MINSSPRVEEFFRSITNDASILPMLKKWCYELTMPYISVFDKYTAIEALVEFACKERPIMLPAFLFAATEIAHTSLTERYILESLLRTGMVELNPVNADGVTPLMVAIESGHMDVIRLFLTNKNVQVNHSNADGDTPLHLACQSGNHAIVTLLLARPSLQCNVENKYGDTPLHLACQSGNHAIVTLLLARPDLQCNGKNKYGYTPLHRAIYNGHTQVVACMLTDHKVNVNKVNESDTPPLSAACEKGATAMVELFLANSRVNVNEADARGDTPFNVACQYNQPEVVAIMLANKRVDCNQAKTLEDTPFWIACQMGHTVIVQQLLRDSRIDPMKANTEGKTALDVAREMEHTEVVSLLLAAQSSPRIQSLVESVPSSLHAAYENGLKKGDAKKAAEEVRALIESNVTMDVNEVDCRERTVLMLACQNGHKEVVEVLLAERRVDVNRKDKKDLNALNQTIFNAYREILALLLADTRLDVNQQNAKGLTPLMNACKTANQDIALQLLAHHRVDIMIKDKEGKTALMHACRFSSKEVVAKLLKNPLIDVAEINRTVPGAHGNIFWMACNDNKQEVAAHLLTDLRVEVNQIYRDMSALHIVLLKDNSQVLAEFLLKSPRIIMDDGLFETTYLIEKAFSIKSYPIIQRFITDSRCPAIKAEWLDGYADNPACYPILDLLLLHEKLPQDLVLSDVTQQAIRAEMKKLRSLQAAKYFALSVFMGEGLLQLSAPATTEPATAIAARRFFGIIKRLHLDAQMVLCNRMAGITSNTILNSISEPAFRELASAVASPAAQPTSTQAAASSHDVAQER